MITVYACPRSVVDRVFVRGSIEIEIVMGKRSDLSGLGDNLANSIVLVLFCLENVQFRGTSASILASTVDRTWMVRVGTRT